MGEVGRQLRPRLYGVCTRCGRTVPGKPTGRGHARPGFINLSPHLADPARPGRWCIEKRTLDRVTVQAVDPASLPASSEAAG